MNQRTGTGSRAVLWDMDGTLIDSEEFHWQAWREAMAAEGVAITREQFLSSFGQRNDSIIPQWLGARCTPELVARIGDAKEKLYRQQIREKGISPLPGVNDCVHMLHESGWSQAIASAAPRANVELVLEVLSFASFFQALVSAEDVRKGKPDPEVFLTAAARLGVPSERCIVVEDAVAGIQAAGAAGMRSIYVHSRPQSVSADLTVRSLDLLPPDVFENLISNSDL